MTASFYCRYLKRAMDLVAAAVLFTMLAPVMLGVYIVLLAAHGRPVLFYQRRPGLHGRVFTMIKLRTMTEARDQSGKLLPDEQRLTRLGRLVRSLSLDEVPQLWNVLKGEMSLIGPRPLLCEYLSRYTPEQNRRHEVRPGITGWAQINGRQDIPFSKRLELDVWYVNHVSLGLDCYIFWRSCVIAALGHGVRSGQDVRDVDDLGLYGDADRPTSTELTGVHPPRPEQAEEMPKEASDDTDRRLDRAA